MNNIREDKNKIQDIIQDIGSIVTSILPNRWYKVVMGYFVAGEEQISHFQLHTITDTSDDYIDLVEEAWEFDESDDVLIDLQELCEEMRKICVLHNDNWAMMTLTLLADGTFNIDYDYETIVDYDSKYILKWQSKYLD